MFVLFKSIDLFLVKGVDKRRLVCKWEWNKFYLRDLFKDDEICEFIYV